MGDGMTKRDLGGTVGDYGPSVQRRNGRIEVVDAPDPGAPVRTIRRARVVCHYDTAWQRGHISGTEREAADRYAIICEREAGATEGRAGHASSNSPWQRTPALTALQASATLRAAHEAVGRDAAALLRLYVRDNVPCADLAHARGECRKQAMGRIRASLARLAEHWEM